MAGKPTAIPEEEYLKWKNLIYHVISSRFSWVFQDRKHFSGNPFGVNTVQLEDMVQAGAIGLNNAWLHFDPSRGVLFKTFAYIGIFNSISNLVDKERNFVRRNRRLVKSLINQKGFFLRAELRDTKKDTMNPLRKTCFYDSFSSPVPLANRTVSSNNAEDEMPEIKMDADVVRQKVIEICGEEKADVLFRWTNGESYQVIADSLGVSKQRVGQYMDWIKQKVREEWADAKLLSTT